MENMSLRGVRQLKELVVRYSDIDGSSRGVREWMRTHMVPLAEKNPALVVKTEKKRATHPFLRGVYLNGNEKTICVKNLTPGEVHDYAMDLRNQLGRKTSSHGYKKPVMSTRPSIQGEWHEGVDMAALKVTIE